MNPDIFRPTTMEMLISRGGDRRARALDLMHKALTELPDDIERCKQLAEAQQIESAMKELHRVRGSISSVGAVELAEIMKTVEKGLPDRSSVEIEAGFFEISEAVARLTTAMNAWFEEVEQGD